jgi:hypothetical protein
MIAAVRPRPAWVVAGVLLAAALGGCTDAPESADVVRQPFMAVARFAPRGEVTVIEVTVNDRQALRAADLAGPGGVVIAADSVDVSQAAEYQPPFGRQSIAGGMGAVTALPLGAGGNLAAAGSQTVTSGQLHSTALIRLDDPASYARDWRLWQVRLRIGDPPHVNVVTLPAPQPPPSL